MVGQQMIQVPPHMVGQPMPAQLMLMVPQPMVPQHGSPPEQPSLMVVQEQPSLMAGQHGAPPEQPSLMVVPVPPHVAGQALMLVPAQPSLTVGQPAPPSLMVEQQAVSTPIRGIREGPGWQPLRPQPVAAAGDQAHTPLTERQAKRLRRYFGMDSEGYSETVRMDTLVEEFRNSEAGQRLGPPAPRAPPPFSQSGSKTFHWSPGRGAYTMPTFISPGTFDRMGGNGRTFVLSPAPPRALDFDSPKSLALNSSSGSTCAPLFDSPVPRAAAFDSPAPRAPLFHSPVPAAFCDFDSPVPRSGAAVCGARSGAFIFKV